MTTDLQVRPTSAEQSAGAVASPAPRRRSRLAVVAAAAVVSLLLAVGLGRAVASDVERVEISFPGDPNAVVSDWGNEEVYGAAGSHVLLYEHGDTTQLRLPWSGGEVTAAQLGDDEHNLLTATGVTPTDDALLIDIVIGNCRYFHERAIDIYTEVRLTLATGDTVAVPFDKPLLVKSPMLASCPDRTLDRGDDARGETFRRGG